MATLSDRKQRYSFTLLPVLPTLAGPHNAYDMRLAESGQTVLERRYTTYPWSPDGHWNVWRLIRAFRAAPQVMEAKTDINLSGSGGPQFREGVVLRVETGWLTALLSGHTVQGRHFGPAGDARFLVEVHVLDGPQMEMAEQGVVPFLHAALVCSPEHVAQFGDDLLAECREALWQRRELGLAAPADEYIDEIE